MMNCLTFGNDNYCLWILIILLILCCCGTDTVCGIIDKLTNCCWILPVLLVLCCCGKGNGFNKNFGCGCGK